MDDQNIQLNKAQIEKIFQFVTSKYVKYKDVQYELVDHLASGVEEQLASHPDRTFQYALELEYTKFPITGFYQFIEEKEKALEKYWNRKMLDIAKSYFTIPRIIFTIILFTIWGIIFWNNELVVTQVIGIILSVFCVIAFWVASSSYKSQTENYLFVKQFHKVIKGIIFMGFAYHWYINPSKASSFGLIQMQYNLVGIVTSIIFTLQVMLLCSYYKGELKHILLDEIDKKYAHLDIKMA